MSIAYPDKTPGDYARSTALVKIATAPLVQPRHAPKPLSRHARLCLIVGALGMGLWAAGWLLFGSASLGFVGLCLIGVVAIFTSLTRGGEEVAQPTPPPAVAVAWPALTYTERLHLWQRLTQDEKVAIIRAAMEDGR